MTKCFQLLLSKQTCAATMWNYVDVLSITLAVVCITLWYGSAV